MIHIYVEEPNTHYGVSVSGNHYVLAQVMDHFDQVRVMLTPREAREFATILTTESTLAARTPYGPLQLPLRGETKGGAVGTVIDDGLVPQAPAAMKGSYYGAARSEISCRVLVQLQDEDCIARIVLALSEVTHFANRLAEFATRAEAEEQDCANLG